MVKKQHAQKILYVITKSNWGGAQRYVFDLATTMRTSGHEVAVALGGTGPLFQKLNSSGIKTFPIPSLTRDVSITKDFSVLFDLVSILRKERPDVIHVNSSKIGGLGGVAARLAGIKKIIFTAHGWAFNEDRSPISKLIIKILYWITMMLAHHTIAVGEAARDQVMRWPCISKKISVVHNGIASPKLLERSESRKIFIDKFPRLAKKGIWIGTVAELHPIKGHAYMLEAMNILLKQGVTDIAYLLIGDGELRETLQDHVEEMGLADHVIFFGHLDEAAKYLKALDIFVLPSNSEGLGYAIIEAGFAGLPVVATRVGGIPEIIVSGENGLLFEKTDTKELAQHLNSLIKNPGMRQTFGTALASTVKDKFTVEKMAKGTVQIYRS
jgi:glycosyltransferase involved in cell wall biosynthesis